MPSLTVGGAPVFLPTSSPLLPAELRSRLHLNPRTGRTAAHICSQAPPVDMAPCTEQVRALVGQVDNGLGRLSPKGLLYRCSLVTRCTVHYPLLGIHPGVGCQGESVLLPEKCTQSPRFQLQPNFNLA